MTKKCLQPCRLESHRTVVSVDVVSQEGRDGVPVEVDGHAVGRQVAAEVAAPLQAHVDEEVLAEPEKEFDVIIMEFKVTSFFSLTVSM